MGHFGLNRCAELGLTFADDVRDLAEANRRWHSLAVNVLLRRYSAWLRILARGEGQQWHLHGIVAGDFAYRLEIDFLHATLPLYGFGPRLSLNSIHWPNRFASYLSKNALDHLPTDKGRFVTSSRTAGKSIATTALVNKNIALLDQQVRRRSS